VRVLTPRIVDAEVAETTEPSAFEFACPFAWPLVSFELLPFVEEVGVSGPNPLIPCFAREVRGTTVRVECVPFVSRDEPDESEGAGDGVRAGEA